MSHKKCFSVTASSGRRCTSTWRSVGVQNENDKLWPTKFCSLLALYFKCSAAIHTWTVPEDTKYAIVSFGLRSFLACPGCLYHI